MGARSLTHIKDEDGKTITTLYRQCDGYPAGHGNDLLKILRPLTLCDGIPVGSSTKYANGMGCLAAQVVKALKDEAGGIYIFIADSSDCGEDYVYTVFPREEEIWLSVEGIYGAVNTLENFKD